MAIRGKPPKKHPVVAMTPDEATKATYTEYLKAKLLQLEQAVIDANKAGSWQAMFSGAAKAMECRRELDAEIAKAASPDDGMSDEQLLGIIVSAVANLPPQHLERLEDAIEMRRTGKVVRLAGNA